MNPAVEVEKVQDANNCLREVDVNTGPVAPEVRMSKPSAATKKDIGADIETLPSKCLYGNLTSAPISLSENKGRQDGVLEKQQLDADKIVAIGENQLKLGNILEAMNHLRSGLQLQKSAYGDRNMKVVETLKLLCKALGEQRLFTERAELLLEAIDIEKSHYGDEQESVFMTVTMISLGMTYFAMHRYLEARKWIQDALNIQEMFLGRNHESVGTSLYFLAPTYGMLGDHQKEAELLEQSVQILRAIEGSEHYLLQHAKKRLMAAKEMAENNQNSTCSSDTDSDTSSTCSSMSDGYKNELQHSKQIIADRMVAKGKLELELGNITEATGLLRFGLQLQKSAYGDRNSIVVTTMKLLSDTLAKQVLYGERRDLLLEAVEIEKSLYGDGVESVRTTVTMTDLGMTYFVLGDFLEARKWLEEALEIQEKFLGRESEAVGTSLYFLASTYKMTKDHEKEAELLEESVKILKEVGNRFGGRHELLSNAKKCLKAAKEKVMLVPPAEDAVDDQLTPKEGTDEVLSHSNDKSSDKCCCTVM